MSVTTDAPDQATELRTEVSPKRVRVLFGGEFIADTTNALMVWEWPWFPTYYFPAADVNTAVLQSATGSDVGDRPGPGGAHDVRVGDNVAPGAARWVPATDGQASLRDHIRFNWSSMDAWFEEDDRVYVHARDPYHRVDILASSRHVRIEVDGVTIAESRQPRMLFETGLPARYYLPATDVRLDLLEPSGTRSECAYKGNASYYHVITPEGRREDLVWWYPMPARESTAIAGLLCFYNEKVDMWVDGEAVGRPDSPFS